MKILYVIGSMGVGGAEKHLFNVATHLKQRGHELCIFTFDPTGPLKQAYHAHNIQVKTFPQFLWLKKIYSKSKWYTRFYLLLTPFYLLGVMWRFRPQVTHYFLPMAYIIGGLVSIFAPKTKRVMSRRSLNNYQKKYHYLTKIEYWLHSKMDVIAGNSKAVLLQLKQEGVSEDKLKLIYNGIIRSAPRTLERYFQLRKKYQIDPQHLVMVIVANLIPYKGHLDLIQALQSIRYDLPENWKLLIIGRDDGIQKDLEQEIIKYHLEDHIQFLGAVAPHDVHEIIQVSDIGILASHEEGFSNAILEYMASGLPVVATNVGGNAEAIISGENGLIVPAQNPQALGDALLTLTHSDNRLEMGWCGYLRVKNLFDIDACVEQYDLMYQGLQTGQATSVSE